METGPIEISPITADILQKQGIIPPQNDPIFFKLLNILKHVPLISLQTILPYLSTHTPLQLLEKLGIDGESTDESLAHQSTTLLNCMDYIYGYLDTDARSLLAVLAPFQKAINKNQLSAYLDKLEQQPALQSLPLDNLYDLWDEMIDRQLVSRHSQLYIFWLLPPSLSFLLRAHLTTSNNTHLWEAIQAGFLAHYDELSFSLWQLMMSQEKREKELGQRQVELEYDNLVVALELALIHREKILPLYRSLVRYLNSSMEHDKGLAIGKIILAGLDNYPVKELVSQQGFDIAGIIEDIANRQMQQAEYALAEQSYLKSLELIPQIQGIDDTFRAGMIASIHTQLAKVATHQTNNQLANTHYQKALQFFEKSYDQHGQAKTYIALGQLEASQQMWIPALNHYQQALLLYSQSDDQKHLQELWQILANFWQTSGQDETIPMIMSVLKLSRKATITQLQSYL